MPFKQKSETYLHISILTRGISVVRFFLCKITLARLLVCVGNPTSESASAHRKEECVRSEFAWSDLVKLEDAIARQVSKEAGLGQKADRYVSCKAGRDRFVAGGDAAD